MYTVLSSLLLSSSVKVKGDCVKFNGWCEPGECCSGMYCDEWGINECAYCIKKGDDCQTMEGAMRGEESCCSGLVCKHYKTKWLINYFRCESSSADIDPSPPKFLWFQQHRFFDDALISFAVSLITVCCIMVFCFKYLQPYFSKRSKNYKVVIQSDDDEDMKLMEDEKL